MRKTVLLLGCALVLAAGHGFAANIRTFGELEIIADDGSFSARFRGRVHADANIYKSGSDERRLTSGAYMRRARFGVQGNFHAWEYAVESDFAAKQTELKDGYLRRIIGPGKLSVGQFKVFEGLERLTSSSNLTFIERSYVGSIHTGYQLGVGYNGTIGPVGFSGNVYNLRAASDDEARPTDAGAGVVARAFFAPVVERMMALHVGGSVAYEGTDRNGRRVRLSPAGRAEEYRDETDFRFTVFDRWDERATVERGTLEALAINGALSVQGEFLVGSARTGTRPGDDFTAWYAQVSYIPTGEWRRYAFRRGRVERPQPSRETGALEVAVRYQQLERRKVDGARLTATDLGLTYYADNNVRFLVNYTMANNKALNDQPHVLALRAQFDF